jgi:hypothetical protein
VLLGVVDEEVTMLDHMLLGVVGEEVTMLHHMPLRCWIMCCLVQWVRRLRC